MQPPPIRNLIYIRPVILETKLADKNHIAVLRVFYTHDMKKAS
jgi:hypothetical protein